MGGARSAGRRPRGSGARPAEDLIVAGAQAPAGDGAPAPEAAEPAIAAGAGGPAADGAPALSFGEACAALAVSPHVLRRVMDEYEDCLPGLVESGAERRLPQAALGVLSSVVAWRNAGLGQEEIRGRLRGAGAAGDPGAAGPGAALERVLGEMASLQEHLRRSEERQAEERDRLLTALLRTQQEIQHLRFELTATPRRDRRRGLWRLFR